MTPLQSITTCLRKYADFTGRASRSEFWWFSFAQFILILLFEYNDLEVFSFFENENILTTPLEVGLYAIGFSNGFFSTLTSVLLFSPMLAVTCRRQHDVGISGWWQGLFYVAVLTEIPFLSAEEGSPGYLIPLVTMMAVFIALVIIWLRPGQDRPNRFGPPPDYDQTLKTFD